MQVTLNKAKHHLLAAWFFIVECRNADCNAFVVAITSEFRTNRESVKQRPASQTEVFKDTNNSASQFLLSMNECFFLQIANKPCSKVSGAWRSSANDDLCSMLFLICERSARYPWIRLMLSFICWKNNVRSFTFSKLNRWKPEFGDWTITSPSNNVYTFNYSFRLKISVACLCNDCIAFSVTQGNERKWKTKYNWSFL